MGIRHLKGGGSIVGTAAELDAHGVNVDQLGIAEDTGRLQVGAAVLPSSGGGGASDALPIATPGGAQVIDDDSVPWFGALRTVVIAAPDDDHPHPAVLSVKPDGVDFPTLVLNADLTEGLWMGDGSDDPSNQSGIAFDEGLHISAFAGRQIRLDASGMQLLGDGTGVLFVTDLPIQGDLNFVDAFSAPVLIDRTTSALFRLVVDNGELGIEAV